MKSDQPDIFKNKLRTGRLRRLGWGAACVYTGVGEEAFSLVPYHIGHAGAGKAAFHAGFTTDGPLMVTDGYGPHLGQLCLPILAFAGALSGTLLGPSPEDLPHLDHPAALFHSAGVSPTPGCTCLSAGQRLWLPLAHFYK